MDKVYDHRKYEQKIYSLWEKNGAFTPKVDKSKNPFTIIMPPPNANDPLHVGHAREVATQDILIRYHRMKGNSTLWLPGSDHAGIETQYVFEKKLREKGKSRSDYDRDTLYNMIWDYVKDNTGVMEKQLRQLGASCDWSRFKFTLDEKIIKIVYKTFKKLYYDGLIYRGERIVNYCPLCGTSFSQLEVNYIEKEDELYYLDYETLTIATTRPETIFADVAIAVNPKDNKYKKLVGKAAKIPLINREVPIITDRLVDLNFGTGALKVTPGHDPVDFEIGEKHIPSIISVIDMEGKMINTPEKYISMKASVAREEVVKDLEEKGYIKKRERLHHSVGVCYKHKTPIEPIVSKQWFIKVKPLAEISKAALKKGEVKIVAKKYDKIAHHWLNNLKDWNISRQIVWGIRIPAWRCDKCLEWTITDGVVPKNCVSCGHEKLIQDPDTFDTWFSSGQWPYATLLAQSRISNFQFPISKNDKAKFEDFDYFYPTSVMNPAYDILPFWVIRMIMLGLYATTRVPFKIVLLHGLVRDRFGVKISKSKGNVINPIEMINKYGADSLRMASIWGSLVENDSSLSEDNIRGQRNFANKIWNAARFIFLESVAKRGGYSKAPTTKNSYDLKIIKQLRVTTKKVTRLLEKYRLNEAAETLYDFFWNQFANDYLEKTKSRRKDAQKILDFVLQESLKLLHPFMPFVTEAIWQESKNRFNNTTLISSSWPK
ncbi:valine--tRNA ligase [Candidatus Woesebacteria bacterium RIFCSPHIGHO2_02_FULL_39_13]|uniref:Valine--tRNA ligase n=1 Tax=Candidatus Woesebacteria bacterium RIFCSPHIGHO2_02_FULL_39_13 TaxID=1802505 RepID=A0A1F7Z535_9BACT|nr:MAG: valine--tRNA ligase [Candidatus Woesebacteria bacterium RIFCSPHIGHO2_02_FULL_39_13]